MQASCLALKPKSLLFSMFLYHLIPFRPVTNFYEDGISEDIVNLRYKHHLVYIKDLMNQIIDLRKSTILYFPNSLIEILQA